MTIEELLDIASRPVVFTDEDVARIKARLEALDKQFLAQAESMRPTAEFLNRLYTL